MAVLIGSVTLVQAKATSIQVATPAATGGSGSVSVVMYQSTVSGFTPGSAADAIGTASALPAAAASFTGSNLVPGTVYYYSAIATDSLGSTGTAAQVTGTSAAYSPVSNQFAQSPYLGMLDLSFNGDTITCQFDPSATGSLVAGAAVVFSTSGANAAIGASLPLNTVPLIKPSTAGSDLVVGFVNYNIKNAVFLPGDQVEISMGGNVMYLLAATAINRGGQVNSLPSGVAGGANGAVVAAVSGSPWVGVSLDQAVIGSFVRVLLQTPANSILHS